MAETAKMSAEDKKWQAENDARTLAEAEVIKNDSSRLKAAQNAAKGMAKEKQDEASAMSNVAQADIMNLSKADGKKA